MGFEADYRYVAAAARNEKPGRLPIYEHLINVEFMEAALGRKFGELLEGDDGDVREFFRHYCGFYEQMTYDTVSFEGCVCEILPEGGALVGERAGPIQSRADFEDYPWGELSDLFWQVNGRRFEALAELLPAGMKVVGGVGNGVFEISEDLVGFESLCYLQHDDPELFSDLYRVIGDLLVRLWSEMLERFGELLAVARVGDDMGFKSSTLISAPSIIEHVVPQYKRVIATIHGADKPFLLHSCGCIFDVMEHFIAAGIDAKHSNEDVIAPFSTWIEKYNDRIGLFGGIDLDWLCVHEPDEVYEYVLEVGTRYRNQAHGFALGSGNSIPEYVPVETYRAMIRAAQQVRVLEAG